MFVVLFSGAKVQKSWELGVCEEEFFCAHTTLFWLKYQKRGWLLSFLPTAVDKK
jgi:hypothetical protein